VMEAVLVHVPLSPNSLYLRGQSRLGPATLSKGWSSTTVQVLSRMISQKRGKRWQTTWKCVYLKQLWYRFKSCVHDVVLAEDRQ